MSKDNSLKKKILFTIGVLLFYRFGSFVPVPVVDINKLTAFAEMTNKGIFGMFNIFSGGAISRCSVFALGIMPYITASIIIQLVVATTPRLKQMNKIFNYFNWFCTGDGYFITFIFCRCKRCRCYEL